MQPRKLQRLNETTFNTAHSEMEDILIIKFLIHIISLHACGQVDMEIKWLYKCCLILGINLYTYMTAAADLHEWNTSAFPKLLPSYFHQASQPSQHNFNLCHICHILTKINYQYPCTFMWECNVMEGYSSSNSSLQLQFINKFNYIH